MEEEPQAALQRPRHLRRQAFHCDNISARATPCMLARSSLSSSKKESMRKPFSPSANSQPRRLARGSRLSSHPKHFTGACCQASLLHRSCRRAGHWYAPIAGAPGPLAGRHRRQRAALVEEAHFFGHHALGNGHLASPGSFPCQTLSSFVSACNASICWPKRSRTELWGIEKSTDSTFVHPGAMEPNRTCIVMA